MPCRAAAWLVSTLTWHRLGLGPTATSHQHWQALLPAPPCAPPNTAHSHVVEASVPAGTSGLRGRPPQLGSMANLLPECRSLCHASLIAAPLMLWQMQWHTHHPTASPNAAHRIQKHTRPDLPCEALASVARKQREKAAH